MSQSTTSQKGNVWLQHCLHSLMDAPARYRVLVEGMIMQWNLALRPEHRCWPSKRSRPDDIPPVITEDRGDNDKPRACGDWRDSRFRECSQSNDRKPKERKTRQSNVMPLHLSHFKISEQPPRLIGRNLKQEMESIFAIRVTPDIQST